MHPNAILSLLAFLAVSAASATPVPQPAQRVELSQREPQFGSHQWKRSVERSAFDNQGWKRSPELQRSAFDNQGWKRSAELQEDSFTGPPWKRSAAELQKGDFTPQPWKRSAELQKDEFSGQEWKRVPAVEDIQA